MERGTRKTKTEELDVSYGQGESMQLSRNTLKPREEQETAEVELQILAIILILETHSATS